MAKPPKQPNFRILSPNAAKDLANRNKLTPESTPTQTPGASSAAAESPSQGPTLGSKRPVRAFFSNLRRRYSALPRPVQQACRGFRILAPLVPISLFFSEHVMQVMWVRGQSMTPYLNEDYHQDHTKGDMVLVSMMPHRIWPWERQRRLERGMVVTFRKVPFHGLAELGHSLIFASSSPANSSHIAIKRIVGLPGDRITTREPCLKQTQIVPFNHVWLEGDAQDPQCTLDSNTYGPVSISLLSGRVFAVLGPRMRWLNWTDWETGKLDDACSEDGQKYRQGVRNRVLKEAVKLERPNLD
ncbi:hypothetical protein N7532_002060 [Penicillium argentinense]|uniref:Mitochondrial inner membrane protease subunit 2 n=1 Tax=Penicillium argentinense TaxID=1131581 RepID=A0A9W9KMD1_9EURO|nr:uncharacterized protein N7532_002060 [Penicillium argentinense]KAJ5111525.1 hypothetical protein N7532_002060 [Penicillium argentinense]